MKAPKCKSCGKEEWRHTCGSLPRGESWGSTTTTKARSSSPTKTGLKPSSVSAPHEGHHGTLASPTNAASAIGGTSAESTTEKPKTDRKVYLKLKARERRTRESEEAKRLGIEVKEFRKRQKAKKDAGKPK